MLLPIADAGTVQISIGAATLLALAAIFAIRQWLERRDRDECTDGAAQEVRGIQTSGTRCPRGRGGTGRAGTDHEHVGDGGAGGGGCHGAILSAGSAAPKMGRAPVST